MATAGSRRANCKSREEFCTSPIRPENNEELHNVPQEAGRNNSTGVTDQGGSSASISSMTWILEIEQMLKQKTFTRSEAQRLIALVHSRTIEEESPSSLLRLEPSSTSGSLKRLKHGEQSDNFHASVVISPQHPTTIENLPHELLVNIFIRLFSKQLAQMRSVSKSWNALLSQSSFVKSHLSRSIHNNHQILLLFYFDVCISDSKPFRAHLFISPHLELTEFNKLVPVNPKHGSTNGIRIIGAVNGLICSSYDDNSVIHIWNPSLSAILTLPKYPKRYNRSYQVHLRFGYDPKANDYKAVQLTGIPHIGTSCKKWLQIGVYSMRKGSWELISERFPSHVEGLFLGDIVCVDGHDGILHWVGYCTRRGKYMEIIVAFDLGSHTFHEILFPQSEKEDLSRLNILSVLAGKVCVMSWGGDTACEVWVMEEYGVVDSWVQRHVFPQVIGRACPYGFTSHGDFLFRDNDDRFVLYNTIANKAKIIEDFCYRKRHYPQNFVEYVDSLVWIAPDKP